MKKILLSILLVASAFIAMQAQTPAAEAMPQFPGGEKALMEFVSKNLVYPEQAIKDEVQGRVIVEFNITKEGAVENAKILRNLSPECDAEVLRIVGIMPQWIPATKDGNSVDSSFVLPVVFKF
jgi:TonB family protein